MTTTTIRRPCKDEVDLTAMVVGDFGKWQLQISVLMALLKLPAAWYQLNIIFMNPPQDFWCVKPSTINCTFEEWNRICSPYIDEFPCLIFDPEILIKSPSLDRAYIPLVECPKFIFDNTTWIRTMTSEWNQVCNGHWLVHLTQCVMMWGIFVGSLVFGLFADKVGRKHTLMTAIVLQSALSFLVTISPNYYMFIITWFILSLASGGIGIISFVMCVEVVSGKWRTTIPVLYQLPFGIGNALMAGLAYWLRDWRMLELTLSILSSLYISYCFLITESPRWLLATGRTEEALEVLEFAAKKNGRPFDIEKVRHLIPEPGPKIPGPNFIEFMKSKNMRLKTILLSINWFCLGLAFYTFSQYLGTIGENIFLTVALTGIISTPGGLLCVFIITKVGRKTTIWIFQLATALCFVFIQLIPKDKYQNDWPRLGFAGLGFAGMAGTIPSLYLYSGELYPTMGRNAGVGGVTMFARIGSMIAPLIVNLDAVVADLPLTFLAITSFAQMILIFPLPETKDYPLPETLEEAEQFTKRRRKSCLELSNNKEKATELMGPLDKVEKTSYTWGDANKRSRQNKPIDIFYENVYFIK